MKQLDVAAAALVIIGALNWGLVGAFHFDLVAAIFVSVSLTAHPLGERSAA